MRGEQVPNLVIERKLTRELLDIGQKVFARGSIDYFVMRPSLTVRLSSE